MIVQKLVKWVDDRLPMFSFMERELRVYPTPRNLSYWWNFGSLAGIVLVIMIATGIMLAMHYSPDTDRAFGSVERIMRDVNYGWLLRYVHMNGGSMFFLVVYIHLFRGMYYGSYKSPREILWILGVLLVTLMMATAFMGYLLPWGQMSFWAATVITNLFSVIPFVGDAVVEWIRGGFAVEGATLARFYSLHYLFPFLIFGVVVLHMVALHTSKSGNPLGIEVKGPQDTIPFHPYYTVKDLAGLGVMLLVLAAFVFFWPNTFSEAINYVPANPLQTPPHIVPEWYFLPYYAILRAVPDITIPFTNIILIEAKLAGVIGMAGSLMVLFVLPWLDRSPVRSCRFRPISKWFFWLFVADCIILGWIGANPPEGHFLIIGRAASVYYFAHFLVFVPLLAKFEPRRALPNSISEAVLKNGKQGEAA